jgi:CHAD domain-containing protein
VAPLPAGAAAALAPVLDHLARRRQAAHADLARALRSNRARDLRTGWRTWLEEPPAGQRPGTRAGDPVGEVVAARIADAQTTLLDAGRAIDERSPGEDLHELRKDAKKLRYLLECFGGLLDRDVRKAFVGRLKALQDNLGEHQDAEVHVAELQEVAHAIAADVGPDTLIAMGQLTGHLEQRRVATRAEFAARFADYDTRETARTLDALLAPLADR